MIDFEKLKKADLWIVSEEPTAEDARRISAFLKSRHAKAKATQNGHRRKEAVHKNATKPAKSSLK